MRKGINPIKINPNHNSDYYHQLIIPVFIPNNEGYFKDSFNVFKISIESILKTTHPATFITVVDNGSTEEVVHYIQSLYSQSKIHEIINTYNIGKINGVYKALVGHSFPIVTIADADVLFLSNWQKATYDIFETFNKVGAICTTPNSRNIKKLTQNIYFDLFFSSKLNFSKVKNPEAMKDFLVSTNNEKMFRSIHYQKYLTIQDNEIEAVVGAGHYVITFRKDSIKNLKYATQDELLGANLMYDFDKLIVENGFWRVSTSENYTYHMGNVSEKWMYDKLKNTEEVKTIYKSPKLIPNPKNKVINWIKIVAFKKILFATISLWKYFLRFKGLSKEESKQY